MLRALRVVFVSSALAACHSQPDSAVTAPAPLPSAPASAATAVVDASASRTPPKRLCEPTIACGRWSRCRWLELDHVEPDGREVYRVAGSDAGGYGSHYSRAHECWPLDAGPKGCSLYCDAKGACVDGLMADGICTVSGPPVPSPWVCEIRGEECVTR